jgi:hypothetical protein
VITGFAEEDLLDMAVHAARSMGLPRGCRGFSGFEESLEAAQILLDHEGWICTQGSEEATANCGEGVRIFNLGADGRAASLGVVTELDPAAGFDLRVGQ